MVKFTVTQSFQLVRAHTLLHTCFVLCNVGELSFTDDCAELFIVQDCVEICNCSIKLRGPNLSAAALNVRTSQDLHKVGSITFNFLVFHSIDCLNNFIAVGNAELRGSHLDEVRCAVQFGGQKIGISLNRFSIGIQGSGVISSFEEMITFIFEPDRVFILDINIVVVVFLRLVDHFGSGVWGLFELTLTSG